MTGSPAVRRATQRSTTDSVLVFYETGLAAAPTMAARFAVPSTNGDMVNKVRKRVAVGVVVKAILLGATLIASILVGAASAAAADRWPVEPSSSHGNH